MQDKATQRAVLALSIEAHPKSLTISNVAHELGAEGVEQAVAALVAVGLLTRDGERVSASAAAVHFDQLEL